MTQNPSTATAYGFAILSVAAAAAVWGVLLPQWWGGHLSVYPMARMADPFTVDSQSASSQATRFVEGLVGGVVASHTLRGIQESDNVHASASDARTELRHWELANAYTLSIPSIGVKTPVLLPSRRYWDNRDWSLLEQQMQVALSHGTVAYPHSVLPGQHGSLIVAGHSSPPHERAEMSEYGDIFARIPELTEGEKLTVAFGNDTLDYVVDSIRIVDPQDTAVLKQDTSLEELRIITCYPVGTTKDRMIVTARRVR